MQTQFKKYYLANIDCADCAAKLEHGIKTQPGVRFASLNFATGTLHLDADDFGLVRAYIRRVEPEVEVSAQPEAAGEKLSWFSPELVPIAMATLLFLVGLLTQSSLAVTPFAWLEYPLFGLAYLLSGWSVMVSAVRNLLNRSWFDETFLMSIATLGALAINQWPEAVGVMLFYKVGEYLQELSVKRSRRAIQSLLEVRPDHVNVLRNGEQTQVSPEAVSVGETILVRPGERVPLDGVVLAGRSMLDTSALTGESVPRGVGPGESVLGGMINRSALLTLQVSKPFAQSAASRLLELVQHAASRKARTEQFITRFANYYTPLVVLGALGVAVLPPLLLPGAAFTDWLYRALVLLVISCPCALMISIPLGYFGGVGSASRHGILVKGANYLDVLARVKTVVFDKTGTLTQGVFKVTEIVPRNGFDREGLLHVAAQAEANSNHPIAQSIREAHHHHGEEIEAPQHFVEQAGYGIEARVNGNSVLVGSHDFMHRRAIEHQDCDVAGTAVHVAVDGSYAGYLVIADELKEDAAASFDSLRAAGVEEIVMLTGDHGEVAQRIAEQVGVDRHVAELLPGDKVAQVEALMAEGREGKLAFVGDGINDAPALARADVGIAMGALGADAAIETADVVLMTDAPAKVAEAIQIGKRTRRIVWGNITMALVVKAAFILLGIFGVATMWEAVFADVGVTVLAVLNATRILK